MMNSHRKLLLPGAAIGNRNSVFSSALTFHPLLPVHWHWPAMCLGGDHRLRTQCCSLLFGAKCEANGFPESRATGIFKTAFLYHRISQNLFSQTGCQTLDSFLNLNAESLNHRTSQSHSLSPKTNFSYKNK